MEISLYDKVIVISGGTKGVGKQLALQCAADGAHVVISGRDKTSARGIIDAARELPGSIEFKETDLFSVTSIREFFSYVASKHHKLDGFVNYAGISPAATLTECSESLFDDIFDVDIKAAFFCCQESVKRMQASGGGSIILVGSTHHARGNKDRTAYACAKGALNTLSMHIAKHYAEDKIRCNYLVMGWTPTDGELALRKSQGLTIEEVRAEATKAIPMGRMMETSDIIPAMIYLLSDFSTMVTANEFKVNGGELI